MQTPTLSLCWLAIRVICGTSDLCKQMMPRHVPLLSFIGILNLAQEHLFAFEGEAVLSKDAKLLVLSDGLSKLPADNVCSQLLPQSFCSNQCFYKQLSQVCSAGLL